MKKILITGAGQKSFIGRNLKEALQGTYMIFAPGHGELELLNYKALESFVKINKVDIIIHAAIHVPLFNGSEKEYFNDMQMFLNIEKISFFVEKVLYFGSGAEYNKANDICMVKEEMIGNSIPITEYGLAKYTMNIIARQSVNIYNLRLFGIFGKYELWELKFISNLCCKAICNLPLTIRKDCSFDFLYIDDLVTIVKWFLENIPEYHDYNVCYGKPYLLTELAALVKEISLTNQDIVLLDEQKNLDYTADNTRLRNELHGFTFISMQTAIKELYEYYLMNKRLINFEILRKSE
ncbi:CDP-abequose synthase [Spirochaetia bacterium]|nr:CDP-abequose synthase [Spirochaetia bacterium]